MFIRSTPDGRLVARFESDDLVPDHGFVEKIKGKKPEVGDFSGPVEIVIDTQNVLVKQLKVEEALIVVWGFESMKDRDDHNMRKAVLVGGACTNQDLIDLTEHSNYVAYKDPKTDKWKKLLRGGNMLR